MFPHKHTQKFFNNYPVNESLDYSSNYLVNLESVGCKVYAWNGNKMTLYLLKSLTSNEEFA